MQETFGAVGITEGTILAVRFKPPGIGRFARVEQYRRNDGRVTDVLLHFCDCATDETRGWHDDGGSTDFPEIKIIGHVGSKADWRIIMDYVSRQPELMSVLALFYSFNPVPWGP